MNFTKYAIGFLLVLVLVGCSQIFPTVTVQDLPTQAPTEIEQNIEQVVETPELSTEEASASLPITETAPPEFNEGTPTEEGLIETTDVPTTDVPTETTSSASSELRATNPASVNLESGKVQLVEFFAFWCPVCRAMAPIMHELEDQYKGQINFVYLDIDDGNTQGFQESLGFYYQPHIFLLDAEGNVIQQWIGYVQQEELEAALMSATE